MSSSLGGTTARLTRETSTVTARTRGARRHHNTAAKIVGTVGVLGVAATMAGMSTFGSFTDSTTPVGTGVDTAVLSIDLADAGDALSMPFGGGLMLAGTRATSASTSSTTATPP